jgi:hypothetical protein
MNITRIIFHQKYIWALVISLIIGNVSADSTDPKPSPNFPSQKPPIPEKENNEPQVIDDSIDMDLLGDGNSVNIKTETVTHWTPQGAEYTSLTLKRMKSTSKPETIGYFRYPDIYKISIEASPLDPENPKQSFLILNCVYGASGAYTHVYRWDGKMFQEVESVNIQSAQVKTMKDGVNVLLAPVSSDGDEGPDIYAYQKGFMVPSNYKYPEIYQDSIENTLNLINRKKGNPGITIQICSKGLMPFIYAGRVQEGIKLYDRIWSLNKKIAKNPDNVSGLIYLTGLFRSYAYLETGNESAGLEELRKWLPEDRSAKYRFHSYLGDYYYLKNDFKMALKYYEMADSDLKEYKITNNMNKPLHARTPNNILLRKIILLKDLLKN